MISKSESKEPATNVAVATTNACKLCTPLGACLAFRGVAGAIPFLHGSQGCATYIRRYLISHFKEPMDIASSSIDESSTIFGGGVNFKTGLHNVCRQYRPSLIGVATTCLSETIGDDVQQFAKQFRAENADGNGAAEIPPIVQVSTPSYRGTHMDGFHDASTALVEALANGGPRRERQLNLLPGLVSPADLRHLKEILNDFGLSFVMLPDYSETLDGPIWEKYQNIPPGGTTVAAIRSMGQSSLTLQLGRSLTPAPAGKTPKYARSCAGELLQQRFQIPCSHLGLPIGVNETDRFLETVAAFAGTAIPSAYQAERGRLIDAYVDGHKYVFEKRAVIYGEADLVIGLASFLAEIGMIPVLCATGAANASLAERLSETIPEIVPHITVKENVDFQEIANLAAGLEPDLIIGNSKGYSLARILDLPLIRVGFPIHDRIGGGRILHVGYRGAQQLFDTIVNIILERKQAQSPVGYSYM